MNNRDNLAKAEISSCLEQDSEDDSDKTKDTFTQTSIHPDFKFLELCLERAIAPLSKVPKTLAELCANTSTSDRVVRLTSAVIKLVKNFNFIHQTALFDKLSTQITLLRRLLRFNRILIFVRDLVNFVKKEHKTNRDYFDMFFKLVMLFSDVNDILLYFMHLRVFKERAVSTLKQNVCNSYFVECVLWTLLHIYEYFMKEETESEKKTRKINIGKYFMDVMLSHNDYSLRTFTLGAKSTTSIGLASSLVGVGLIWK